MIIVVWCLICKPSFLALYIYDQALPSIIAIFIQINTIYH